MEGTMQCSECPHELPLERLRHGALTCCPDCKKRRDNRLDRKTSRRPDVAAGTGRVPSPVPPPPPSTDPSIRTGRLNQPAADPPSPMTYAAHLAGEAADAGLAVYLLRDGETAVIRLTARVGRSDQAPTERTSDDSTVSFEVR